MSYVVNCIPYQRQCASQHTHTHRWEGKIRSFDFQVHFMSTTTTRHMSIDAAASPPLPFFACAPLFPPFLSSCATLCFFFVPVLMHGTQWTESHEHMLNTKKKWKSTTEMLSRDCSQARTVWLLWSIKYLIILRDYRTQRMSLAWKLPHLCDVTFEVVVCFLRVCFSAVCVCEWVWQSIVCAVIK